MKELWKYISGYKGFYQISNLGRVKSLKFNKERILKSAINSNGYYTVVLCAEGRGKTFTVYCLVAEAFVEKPNDYKDSFVIDHIDHDCENDNFRNLQWVSHRFNLSKDQWRKKPSSKYTGVSWAKDKKKWIAHIQIKGITKHLGVFISEIEAHLAYQSAIKNITR